MKISLIISAYEQPVSLEKVLQGVASQTRMPEEIFIADDGSGPPTRAIIDAFIQRVPCPVHHLWHPHDGFRKTILLNQAVAASTGAYLVFLDGDCVPHRNFLANHEALAERGFWVQGRRCFVPERHVPNFQPNKTFIAGWMLTRRIISSAKGIYMPFPIILRNRRQRGILGCNMAFWRDDVFAVNGFDEAFLGRGIGPDSDLATRVYNLGRQRKFVYGRALVYHLNHPIIPKDNLAAKRLWLQETIRSGRIRCELGLNLHLKPADSPATVAAAPMPPAPV